MWVGFRSNIVFLLILTILWEKNLSRALEDSGTLLAPLVPWSSCAAFMYAAMGVPTIQYIPFAFLCLINPLISIFYGYTGITMEKIPKISEWEEYYKISIEFIIFLDWMLV